MGPGPCPCLGPASTFSLNFLEPIDPIPGPCPVLMQFEYTIMGYITDFSDLKKEVTAQQSDRKAEVLLLWIFTAAIVMDIQLESVNYWPLKR